MSHSLKFAILGAGAMGSIIGAHLARAGHGVTMLARGRRAQQLKSHGLRITGLADFSVPVHVLEDPRQLEAADVFIVTTKAIDTEAALAPYRGAAVGCVFSVQNGVMKNELLAKAFGAERVLGALANISGELLADGAVLFTRNVSVPIGELTGQVSDRVRDVAQALDGSGVHSQAVSDIQSQEWSKFAGWISLAGPAISIRTFTWKFLMDAAGAALVVRLVREIGKLANAGGIELTDESMFPVATLCRESLEEAVKVIQRYGEQFRDASPRHKLSTLQDVEAGRRLEVEETLGFAVRKARELEVPVPLTEGFYEVAGTIDRAMGS